MFNSRKPDKFKIIQNLIEIKRRSRTINKITFNWTRFLTVWDTAPTHYLKRSLTLWRCEIEYHLIQIQTAGRNIHFSGLIQSMLNSDHLYVIDKEKAAVGPYDKVETKESPKVVLFSVRESHAWFQRRSNYRFLITDILHVIWWKLSLFIDFIHQLELFSP